MPPIRVSVTLLLALPLSLATSAAAQPISGPEFIPLATPCRALDTRVSGPKVPANVPTLIKISGMTTGGTDCGVPSTAVGAALNFTITEPEGPGWMTAWPSGTLPLASVVNFVAGETVANAVDIRLGAGGTVLVQPVAMTHLVIDVYGYFIDVEELAGLNTALGFNALASNTTGTNNTAMGGQALFNNTTGGNNTAMGTQALGTNTTGSANIATGVNALGDNTTGSSNTALGTQALSTNTTGGNNTATGAGALSNSTTGIGNTATGAAALVTTTGSSNTAIGQFAGAKGTTGNNNIHIGNNGTAADTALIRIGTGGVHASTFIAGIRGVTTGAADAISVLIDAAGQLGTTSSSRRIKTDIHDLGDQSRALHQLRPVSFRYRSHPSDGPLEYGLIAEEVAEIYPELVVLDKEGQPSGVRYHVLPAMLLNELQRQQRDSEARFAAQQREIDALRAQVRALICGKAAVRE